MRIRLLTNKAKEKESTAPVEVVEEEEVVEEVTPVSKPRTSNVSTRAERIKLHKVKTQAD